MLLFCICGCAGTYIQISNNIKMQNSHYEIQDFET